tara:strand:+ start:23498 stop:23653 length:156 start_codon:yes stop_codon:yes gene_type:complete
MSAPKIWIATHPTIDDYREISIAEPDESGIYMDGQWVEWVEYVLIETGGRV